MLKKNQPEKIQYLLVTHTHTHTHTVPTCNTRTPHSKLETNEELLKFDLKEYL